MKYLDNYFDRRDLWLALLLFSFAVGCGLSQAVFGVTGVFNDDGIYVSTAKALAEGKGYRLINLPDAPFQTKYPILYPAVLAVIWKLGFPLPATITLMQILNLLIGGASLVLCYLYLVRFNYFDRTIAFVSTLFCACSHVFLYFMTNTASEILFLFLTIIMLFAVDTFITELDRSPKRAFITGVLIALPFLCRTIGIAYIAVAFLIWSLRKYSLRWLLAGNLSILLPHILFVFLFCNQNGNSSEIYYTDYGQWWVKYFSENALGIVQVNAMAAPFSVLMISAEGIVKTVTEWQAGTIVPFFLLGCIPFFGMIYHTGGGFLRWFMLGYLGLILIWPWPLARFIIPLAPFLIAYLLHVIHVHALRHMPFSMGRMVAMISLTIVVSMNVYLLYHNYDKQQFSKYPVSPIRSQERVVHWSSHEEIFQWLRTHSNSSDVIACGLDSMIYLYTDRRGFRPFVANPVSLFYGGSAPPLGSSDDFMDLIKFYQPTYLVQVPLGDSAEDNHFDAYLKNIQESHPSLLLPVYVGEDERFVIYKIQQQET